MSPLLDRRQALAGGLGLLGASLAPSFAWAEDAATAAAAAPSPVAGPARPLLSDALRYRLATPGGGVDTGGALLGIHASMDRVTQVVLRYRKYRHILPRLEQSRVLNQEGDSTDVYLRAPILHGLATLWGIARFTGPRPWRDKGQKVVGSLVRGNLDAFRGEWKLYPCGPHRTILRLELYLEVAIPLPSGTITKELAWAADEAVTAVGDMVGCSP